MSALNENRHINKRRKDFLTGIFGLFLSIKGRINFLQLERYGKFGEKLYRQQFEKPFDFMEFNKDLAFTYGSGRFVIAFDLSGYLVADTFFSKKPFAGTVLSMDMHLIRRLRDDADLKYLFHGGKKREEGTASLTSINIARVCHWIKRPSAA